MHVERNVFPRPGSPQKRRFSLELSKSLTKFEKDIEDLFYARLNEIKIIKEHADK